MVVDFLLLTLLPYTLLAFAWVLFIDYFLVLPFTMQRTQGTIIGHESSTNNRDETIYAARFSYYVNGIEYESVNDMWYRHEHPAVGTTIPVEYIRGNEQHAHFVSRFRKLYILGFLVLALYAIYAVTSAHGISNIGTIIFSTLSMLLIFGVLRRHRKQLQQ